MTMFKEAVYKDNAMGLIMLQAKNTNPNDFDSNDHFMDYMLDKEIMSFGKWEKNNGFNAGLLAAVEILEKMPGTETIDTCHGYNIERLVAFGEACRKAGVDEKDLKGFAQNCESSWRAMQREFEYAIREAFEKYKDIRMTYREIQEEEAVDDVVGSGIFRDKVVNAVKDKLRDAYMEGFRQAESQYRAMIFEKKEGRCSVS